MTQTLLSELPAELLSRIFVHSVSVRQSSLFGIPLICQPPLQLLLVSQHWRGIALGTPELWQLLIINHTICKPEAGWGIAGYFSRARSLPLTLRARLPPGRFLKGRLFIPSWENLVSVDISGDTEFQVKIARMMLEDAPMLVSASFEFTNPPRLGHFTIDCPKARLSHLRHLTIKFLCHERSKGNLAISEFFEALVLPVLEELHLETSHWAHDDELPEALVNLHKRSHFPLRYLHIAFMEWNNVHLIQFLRTVPTLEHLYLHISTLDDTFQSLFYMLQYIPESTDNILPNLTKIQIFEPVMLDWEFDDENDLLIGCLESRWWPERSYPYRQEGLRRLSEVAVYWSDTDRIRDDIGASNRTRAQRLRAGGMNLVYPTLVP